MSANELGLDPDLFAKLAAEYRRQWGLPVVAASLEGELLLGHIRCARCQSKECAATRAHAISETLRWGEPTIEFCLSRRLVWAVPLMHNSRPLGGLVASAPERVVLAEEPEPPFDARRACADLRRLAERHNLTNAEFLAARRTEYYREQKRAEAIHEVKAETECGISGMYLREEPALLAAIRKGELNEARGILNRILVLIHYQAGEDRKLIKSFFMELVVTMCRTAVQAGGDARELLGANYASLAALSEIDDDAELAGWLAEILDRLIRAIHATRRPGDSALAAAALQYMAAHLNEELSRDEVARAVFLSPSHFSRLIAKELGRSFTDILNQMRVDHAAQLLVAGDHPLTLIALDAGFRDQSYFTKVFRRYTGATPRQYRRQRRPGSAPEPKDE